VGWLPLPVFEALVTNLTEVEARRHASTAGLASLVYNMFAKQKRDTSDFYPAFARVTEPRDAIPQRFKTDLEIAASRKWLRQELLDAVMAIS